MRRVLFPLQLAGAVVVFATFLTVVVVSQAAVSAYEAIRS